MNGATYIQDGETAPPHNVEAEQQLLGAILSNNDRLDRVSDLVSAGSFHDPVHARIFEVVAARIDAGQLASPVTIKPELEHHEGLAELGGVRYLLRLVGASISGFAVRDYAQIVADMAAKRALLGVCQDTTARIHEGKQGASEIALGAEAAVGNLVGQTSTKPLLRSYLSTLTTSLTQINDAHRGETPVGVATGIPQLDDALGNLRPGQLIVVAGRPGMGKTTLAQNIAFNAAQSGVGAFYGSLEMTAEEWAIRLISKGLKARGVTVPYNRMLNGRLSEAEMRHVVEETKRQEALPLPVGERDVRDTARFRAAARRAQQSMSDTAAPLGLVVVDYLQMMHADGTRSPYERVSAASDTCKTLAMEMNLPVIAVAQLSRSVEQRESKVPMLSDLRESGKLEEDADVVLFCYRAAYYLQAELDAAARNDVDARNDLELELSRRRQDLDIIIGKQRSGPARKVSAFVDMATCHVYADRSADEGELI